MKNYLDINQDSWNAKIEGHLQSDFYELEAFKNGKTSLKGIELDLLNDVRGKSILHLQCHFGQDTMSLSRMGANVMGVDLSDKGIDAAKKINTELDLNTKFIHSDVYDLPNRLEEKYDVVFTSYGVIGWLPDINKWAETIAHFLKPGGKLIFVEFHPFVWMYNDEFSKVSYNYFKDEAIEGEESGSYADNNENNKYKYMCWNHGLGEVVSALLNVGLSIDHLKEYNYSPYDCFANTVKIDEDKYQIKSFEDKAPLCYSIVATKK